MKRYFIIPATVAAFLLLVLIGANTASAAPPNEDTTTTTLYSPAQRGNQDTLDRPDLGECLDGTTRYGFLPCYGNDENGNAILEGPPVTPPDVCFLSDGTVLLDFVLSEERTGTTRIGSQSCGPEELYCGYAQVPVPCDTVPSDPVSQTLPSTGNENVVMIVIASFFLLGGFVLFTVSRQ